MVGNKNDASDKLIFPEPDQFTVSVKRRIL